MRRAQRGYTLMEVVVALSIFGVFIIVVLSLTVEMYRYERDLPVNFLRHPQIIAVVARMRRDVLDAHGKTPYRSFHDGYSMSPKTLILESVQENGGVQTIVWDFSTPGLVVRRAYNVGNVRQWAARGVPRDFSAGATIEDVDNPGRAPGVRLIAVDKHGRIALDQIFLPRASE